VTWLAGIDPGWGWILASLILMGGELLIPGIFLVWLGLAAFATGLIEAVFDMPWQIQLPVFAVFSIATVTLATRFSRAPLSGLNLGAHRLVGREFLLDAAIINGDGRVRFDDTLWRVHGPDLPAGTRVKVTGVDGTSLLVAPV
jgi:membrane protein implicated in regulation of membrane protease activity